MFIPHLLPWRDPKILCSLTIRITVAIMNRGLNVAIPRELGISIDKLSSGTGIMPWKGITIWACYLWLNSSAGFDILDSLATARIRNSSYKQITELAMGHIMGLSLDFHPKRDRRGSKSDRSSWVFEQLGSDCHFLDPFYRA